MKNYKFVDYAPKGIDLSSLDEASSESMDKLQQLVDPFKLSALLANPDTIENLIFTANELGLVDEANQLQRYFIDNLMLEQIKKSNKS